MNAHAHISAAEAAQADTPNEWTKQRVNMRSLALNLRKHSHRYRQWAREAAALGKTAAARGFTETANRYADDALWYWRRAAGKN